VTKGARRIALGLAAALATASMAAAQPPPSATRSVKRAILDIAVREWRRFGAPLVFFDAIPARLAPPRLAGAKPPEVLRCGHIRERYWGDGVGKKELSENGGAGRAPPYRCDTPWSAAFVSAVLREAGVSEADFDFNELHQVYVKGILKRHRAAESAGGIPAPFVPRDIADHAPKPGDLICAVRPVEGARSFTVYKDIAAWEAANHALGHCDIVVRVERAARRLGAIGGNVKDTVARSIVALDEAGRLIPTLERPWFIVIENRLP
jgi:hypothetical protein